MKKVMKINYSALLLWGLTLTFAGGLLTSTPAGAAAARGYHVIHEAHGVYRSGDVIDLSHRLYLEHPQIGVHSKTLVRAEVWAENPAPGQAELALYVGSRKVGEGKIEARESGQESLQNEHFTRGKKWYLKVIHGPVNIGDIVIFTAKKKIRRSRTGRR